MIIFEAVLIGIVIGAVLGTIGAGGAILAVPALITILNFSTIAATTSSLVIVGAAAISGFIPRIRNGLFNIKLALTFSILGIAGNFFGTYLIDYIPDRIQINLFALLMFVSAIAMWRGPVKENIGKVKTNFVIVILVSSTVGFVTGLLGVGGGFLILPALVLILKLPIKVAAGTSLLVIAINALVALLFRYQYWEMIPITKVFALTISAIITSFLFAPLAQKIDARMLQKVFSIFIVVIAVFVLVY